MLKCECTITGLGEWKLTMGIGTNTKREETFFAAYEGAVDCRI